MLQDVWRRLRGAVSVAAKLAVSGGLLWWLFHKGGVSPGDVLRQWRGMEAEWLALGLGVLVLALVLGMSRWWVLLKGQGIEMPYWECCAIGMISQFFITFSIGVVGGDIARIVYGLRHQPQRKTEVVLSIVADRVLGVLGLCLVALLVMPMNWGLITANRETRALVWAIVALLGGFAFFILLESPGPWRRWVSVMDHLPFRERREQVARALGAYFHHWRSTVLALVMSAVIHLLFIVAWYCVARALRLPVGFGFVAGMVPVVNTATSIPVTVSGFGVREAVLVLFFQAAGLGRGEALATSFTIFGLMAVVALAGGLVYISYRIAPREMREKLESGA